MQRRPEQPCSLPIFASVGIAQRWRLRRRAALAITVLRACTLQDAAFNIPVAETVGNLIGRAMIATRHTEEFFHFAHAEIGDAPRTDLFRPELVFKRRHIMRKCRRPSAASATGIGRDSSAPRRWRLASHARATPSPATASATLSRPGVLVAMTGNREDDCVLRTRFRRYQRHPGGYAGGQGLYTAASDVPFAWQADPGPGQSRSASRI